MNADQPTTPWKKWGPYLSERQWGTVREDYGAGGDTWNYFYESMHERMWKAAPPR